MAADQPSRCRWESLRTSGMCFSLHQSRICAREQAGQGGRERRVTAGQDPDPHSADPQQPSKRSRAGPETVTWVSQESIQMARAVHSNKAGPRWS